MREVNRRHATRADLAVQPIPVVKRRLEAGVERWHGANMCVSGARQQLSASLCDSVSS